MIGPSPGHWIIPVVLLTGAIVRKRKGISCQPCENTQRGSPNTGSHSCPGPFQLIASKAGWYQQSGRSEWGDLESAQGAAACGAPSGMKEIIRSIFANYSGKLNPCGGNPYAKFNMISCKIEIAKWLPRRRPPGGVPLCWLHPTSLHREYLKPRPLS